MSVPAQKLLALNCSSTTIPPLLPQAVELTLVSHTQTSSLLPRSPCAHHLPSQICLRCHCIKPYRTPDNHFIVNAQALHSHHNVQPSATCVSRPLPGTKCRDDPFTHSQPFSPQYPPQSCFDFTCPLPPFPLSLQHHRCIALQRSTLNSLRLWSLRRACVC